MSRHDRMATRRAGLIAAPLLAVMLASCGGGGDFASKANAICKTYNGKIRTLHQPASAAEIPGFLDKVTPLVMQGTAKLKALAPPSDQKAAYQTYISLLDQEVAVTQQADVLARSGKTSKAIAVIQQLGPLTARDKASAKALGLTSCEK